MITRKDLTEKIISLDKEVKDIKLNLDAHSDRIDDLEKEIFRLTHKPLFNDGDMVNCITTKKSKLTEVYIYGKPDVLRTENGSLVYVYRVEKHPPRFVSYRFDKSIATEDNIFLHNKASKPDPVITYEPLQNPGPAIKPFKVTVKLKVKQRSEGMWSFTLKGIKTIIPERITCFYALSFLDAWKAINEDEIEELKIEKKD